MNINTEQEKELLVRFEMIEGALEAKRNADDMRLTIDIQQDIEKVLEQVKVTYPTVKYPISLIHGGCGSCFSNFLGDMLPVYDRLKSQELNNIEIKDTSTQIYPIINVEMDLEGMKEEPEVGSVEYNAKNVNEVNPFNPIGHDDVEEPKAPVKKAGRKAKGK